jgi:outer membrane protein assembly factor BamB
MKKLLIVLIAILLNGFQPTQAGKFTDVVDNVKSLFQKKEALKVKNEIKINHSVSYSGYNAPNGMFFAANQKEITVASKSNNVVVWTKKFSDISPDIRKVDEVVPMWESNTIFVFDRKAGADAMACIDASNGTLRWSSKLYQDVTDENIVYIPEMESFVVSTKSNINMINAKSGTLLWSTNKFRGIVGAYKIVDESYMVMLNMKSSIIGSLFAGFKNQLVRINLYTGEIAWDQTYRGLAQRKTITKEKLVKLDISNGKVFVYLNGLQVYDYATGTQQWNTAYEFSPNVVKAPKGASKFGAYGTVADMVIDNGFAYILDIESKGNQHIKKYNISTSELVWTSPEIKNARAIPNMFVRNGIVVLQVGGNVERQYVQRVKNSDGSFSTRKVVDYVNVKPYNLQAYDAQSGKELWKSDKLSKSITNIIPKGDLVYVSSAKQVFGFQMTDGKEMFSAKFNSFKVGKANMIDMHKNHLIVVGTRGLAYVDMNNGNEVASSRFKKASPVLGSPVYNPTTGLYSSIVRGNSLAMVNAKNAMGVFNLEAKTLKVYKGRSKGSEKYFMNSGDEVFVIEKGSKLKDSKARTLSFN